MTSRSPYRVWSSNCRSVTDSTHTHTHAHKNASVDALFSHRTSHLRPYRTVILTKGFMFCKYCYSHKLNYITACIQRTPFKKETCMVRNNSSLLCSSYLGKNDYKLQLSTTVRIIHVGNGDMAPCVRNVSKRWNWVVSFTPQLFYPLGKKWVNVG